MAECVIEPAKYYRNGVAGTIGFLDAMREAGVSKTLFSSSTATYGIPDHMPITERGIQHPINPYGSTKLMIDPY
jgi:UDP-glucose 4-epimerase